MLSLTVTPGVLFPSSSLSGTTNAEIPLVPCVLSVIANTMHVSANPLFVVKIFPPFIIYSSVASSYTACVCCPAASDPAFGSVSPKQPVLLPSISGLKNFCFCSSVPNPSIHEQHRDVCTEIVIPVLPSTLDTSSMQST